MKNEEKYPNCPLCNKQMEEANDGVTWCSTCHVTETYSGWLTRYEQGIQMTWNPTSKKAIIAVERSLFDVDGKDALNPEFWKDNKKTS